MQIHGLALLMTLGISMRLLPGFYGVAAVPAGKAWTALAILTSAVTTEILVFIVYRWTGNHAFAALLMIPWLMLAIGVWLVAGRWQLWKPVTRPDRSAKFIRLAYGWLASP